MKHKLLLSALSLGLIFSINQSQAGLIHEDFEIFESVKHSPAYASNPLRQDEKNLRDNYEELKKVSKIASQEAGEQAKSWWSWGSSNLKSASFTLITTAPSYTAKAAGVLGWGIGYLGDKLGDIVKNHVEAKTEKTLVNTGLHALDYTNSFDYGKDYQLKSTLGGLILDEMAQDISMIKAAAAA